MAVYRGSSTERQTVKYTANFILSILFNWLIIKVLFYRILDGRFDRRRQRLPGIFAAFLEIEHPLIFVEKKTGLEVARAIATRRSPQTGFDNVDQDFALIRVRQQPSFPGDQSSSSKSKPAVSHRA